MTRKNLTVNAIIITIATLIQIIMAVFLYQELLNKTEERESSVESSINASVPYEIPETIKFSRKHINEQIEYGNTVIESIETPSTYVNNMIISVRKYQKLLELPLPYEEVEPETEEMIDTIIYRSPGESGELTRFQEEELIMVKKQRLDGYHIALLELERRVQNAPSEEQLSQEAYLSELASELPFYVPPIVVGNACGGENTLGCFYNSDEIEITSLALTVNGGNDECLILSTIAHETRHYNQYLESGLKDYIIAELEDDANKFMRDNTPERCKAPIYR